MDWGNFNRKQQFYYLNEQIIYNKSKYKFLLYYYLNCF